MTITMNMTDQEFESLQMKIKAYDNLVAAAKNLVKDSIDQDDEYTYQHLLDCYTFLCWLQNEEIDNIIGQFGVN